MTSEDDTRTRLRVGGWLPPYAAFPPPPGHPAVDVADHSRVPVDADAPDDSPAPAEPDRRRSAALCCAAVAGLLLTGLVLTRGSDEPATAPVAGRMVLPTAPVLPAPPFTVPSTGPVTTGAAGATGAVSATGAARAAVASRATVARLTGAGPEQAAPGRRTSRAPRPFPSGPATTGPASTGLRAGATIGLALDGAPDRRVRHRDFRGRVDPVGADSSALSRAGR